MSDPIYHPNHHMGHTGIEAMDALKSAMGLEAMQYFYWGNAFKYLWRWKEKGGLEDLRKCNNYVGMMIENYPRYSPDILEIENKEVARE